ncbi:uncharacterized protein JCM15063_004726 [Sporobolomyces koalae]|uniref:uncharacterized protein n=1 Tax=Sporobolomyces koalae TaxID=500713 RepID=UPI00317DE154
MTCTLERPLRSQFLVKLHRLLERSTDPDSLRWTSDNDFEVTVNEKDAIAALCPEFSFRSLSSFVRQLSYYNFKRLSDRRRRTAELRVANDGYIRFTHDTAFFIRGDATLISRITRRPRVRRLRHHSVNMDPVTAASDDDEADGTLHTAVALAKQDASTPRLNDQAPVDPHSAPANAGEAFRYYVPLPREQPVPSGVTRWRSYSPSSGFTKAAPAVPPDAPLRPRRASEPRLESTSDRDQSRVLPLTSSAPSCYVSHPAVTAISAIQEFPIRPSIHSLYPADSVPAVTLLSGQRDSAGFKRVCQPRDQLTADFGTPAYSMPAREPSIDVFSNEIAFVPSAPSGSDRATFLSDLQFDPSHHDELLGHHLPLHLESNTTDIVSPISISPLDEVPRTIISPINSLTCPALQYEPYSLRSLHIQPSRQRAVSHNSTLTSRTDGNYASTYRFGTHRSNSHVAGPCATITETIQSRLASCMPPPAWN